MKKILLIGVICVFCSSSVFSQSKKKWEKTQALNSISVYQDFINKYPDGKYTELAKQQLMQLKVQEAKKEELKAKEKAQKISEAKIMDEKIVTGISLDEVISILSWKDLKSVIFPQGVNTFTGTAILNGFELGVENGKVISKKVIPDQLGDQRFETKSIQRAN